MAPSIYFNREASQKYENTTLQTNLKGVIISWREYLLNSKQVVGKSDLASLKAQVSKVGIGKPKTVPTDIIKISNLVDNDVVKKNLYIINWSQKLVVLGIKLDITYWWISF